MGGKKALSLNHLPNVEGQLRKSLRSTNLPFAKALNVTNASHPYEGTLEESQDLWAFTSVLIGTYMDAFRLVDPRTTSDESLCGDQGTRKKQNDHFSRELTWRYVILHSDLATIQHGQRKAIEVLFEVFLDAINRGKYQPSSCLKVSLRLIKVSQNVPPARWAADYISGLTEAGVFQKATPSPDQLLNRTCSMSSPFDSDVPDFVPTLCIAALRPGLPALAAGILPSDYQANRFMQLFRQMWPILLNC